MKENPKIARPISFILPTLNERENIRLLLQILQTLPLAEWEALVIDDKSEDGTAEVVKKMAEADERIRLITRNTRGLPSAIWTGVSHARFSYVCWMDCDLSHPPELTSQMAQELNDYDLVVASRHLPSSHDLTAGNNLLIKFQKFLSSLLSRFCQRALANEFTDWTSGFIVVKKSFLREEDFIPGYGEYFLCLLTRASREQLKSRELAFTSPPRQFGESKTALTFFELFRTGWPYLKTLLRLVLKKRVNKGHQRGCYL